MKRQALDATLTGVKEYKKLPKLLDFVQDGKWKVLNTVTGKTYTRKTITRGIK
jgi:hypothetical protein